MKKTNLIKVISILIVSMMVVLFATNVKAAEENTGFNDLTNTLTSNGANTNNANTNTNSANTNTNNSLLGNTSNNKNNSNNSSIYNNTSLPKTGIEESIPVALLVVVFGISAVYAYKKIKEYRNI